VSGKIETFPRHKGCSYDHSEKVEEWRVKTTETLENFDFFKWYRDNQEDMIARFGSSSLYPHEVLQFFVETVILESLKSE